MSPLWQRSGYAPLRQNPDEDMLDTDDREHGAIRLPVQDDTDGAEPSKSYSAQRILRTVAISFSILSIVLLAPALDRFSISIYPFVMDWIFTVLNLFCLVCDLLKPQLSCCSHCGKRVLGPMQKKPSRAIRILAIVIEGVVSLNLLVSSLIVIIIGSTSRCGYYQCHHIYRLGVAGGCFALMAVLAHLPLAVPSVRRASLRFGSIPSPPSSSRFTPGSDMAGHDSPPETVQRQRSPITLVVANEAEQAETPGQ